MRKKPKEGDWERINSALGKRGKKCSAHWNEEVASRLMPHRRTTERKAEKKKGLNRVQGDEHLTSREGVPEQKSLTQTHQSCNGRERRGWKEEESVLLKQ